MGNSLRYLLIRVSIIWVVVLIFLAYRNEKGKQSFVNITNSSEVYIEVNKTRIDHGAAYLNDSRVIFDGALRKCEFDGKDTTFFPSKGHSMLDYDPPYTLLKEESQNYIKLIKNRDTIIFCWVYSVE